MLLLASVALAASLSLDEAVAAARAHAPDSTVLDARRDLAQGDVGAARAPLLPQISASYTWRHNDKEISFPNPFDPTGSSILSLQKLDVHTASVTGSQMIFNAGSIGRAIMAGKATEAADATLDGATLDLDLRVANLWLAAHAAGELRVATTEAVDAATRHETAAKMALQAGTVTPLAVDRATIVVLDARQKLLDAERSEADLLGQLRVIIGAEEAVTLRPLDTTPTTPPEEETALRAANTRRPELRAAQAQAEAAAAGTWSVVGEWVPSVSAIGNYTWTNSPMFVDDTTSWYVGVAASLPVFDGGLRFADAKKLTANRAVAQATAEKLEASTAEEVRAAVRGERVAQEALGLARAQEETAVRARDLAEAAFGVGTASPLDVEDAQTSALSAHVGRIRAEAAWMGARWARMRLCGEAIGG